MGVFSVFRRTTTPQTYYTAKTKQTTSTNTNDATVKRRDAKKTQQTEQQQQQRYTSKDLTSSYDNFFGKGAISYAKSTDLGATSQSGRVNNNSNIVTSQAVKSTEAVSDIPSVTTHIIS